MQLTNLEACQHHVLALWAPEHIGARLVGDGGEQVDLQVWQHE